MRRRNAARSVVGAPGGSTARPDLDRPRPWLTGVGCTGPVPRAREPPKQSRTLRCWGDDARCVGTGRSRRWNGGEHQIAQSRVERLRRKGQRPPPRRRQRWSDQRKRKALAWNLQPDVDAFRKSEGGSTLPSRRSVSSTSKCMLIANSLPAPARLPARAAHGTAGSGWSTRLS